MAFKIEEQPYTFRWPVTIRVPKNGGGHEDVEIEATMQYVPPSMKDRVDRANVEFREAEAQTRKGESKIERLQELEQLAIDLRKDLESCMVVDLHHIDRLPGMPRIVDEDSGEVVTETVPLAPELKKEFLAKLLSYPHIATAVGSAYRDATSGPENQPKARAKNSATSFAN